LFFVILEGVVVVDVAVVVAEDVALMAVAEPVAVVVRHFLDLLRILEVHGDSFCY